MDLLIFIVPLFVILPSRLGFVNYSLIEVGFVGGLLGILLRSIKNPKAFYFPSPASIAFNLFAVIALISALTIVVTSPGVAAINWGGLILASIGQSFFLLQDTPLHGFSAALGILEGAVFFSLVALRIQEEKGYRSILNALIFSGVIVALAVIYQFVSYQLLQNPSGPIFLPGTWYDANGCASYLLLVIFGLLALWSDKENSNKLINSLMLTVFIVALILCNSRIAYLGFVVGILWFLFFWKIELTNLFQNILKYQLILISLFALFILIFINVSFVRFDPLDPDTLSWMSENRKGTGLFDSRLDLWRRAILLFCLNPLTGIGIGRFFSSSSEHYIPKDLLSSSFNPLNENAHNQYIQYFAELGALGGIIFLLLNVFILFRFFKLQLKENPDEKQRVFMTWLCGGWVAFLITLITGHALVAQEMYLIYAAFIGLFFAPTYFKFKPIYQYSNRFFLLISTVTAVGFLFHNINTYHDKLSVKILKTGFHGKEQDRAGSFYWGGDEPTIYFKNTTRNVSLKISSEQVSAERPMKIKVNIANQKHEYEFQKNGWQILNFELGDEYINRPVQLKMKFDHFWRPNDLSDQIKDKRALTFRFYDLVENLNHEEPLNKIEILPYRIRTKGSFAEADDLNQIKDLDPTAKMMLQHYIPGPNSVLNEQVNLVGYFGRVINEKKFKFSFILHVVDVPEGDVRIKFNGYLEPEHLSLLPEKRRQSGFTHWDFKPIPTVETWEVGDFIILEREVYAADVPYELHIGMYQQIEKDGGELEFNWYGERMNLGWVNFRNLK